ILPFRRERRLLQEIFDEIEFLATAPWNARNLVDHHELRLIFHQVFRAYAVVHAFRLGHLVRRMIARLVRFAAFIGTLQRPYRSEERRVGKERVSMRRYWW